MWSAAMKLTMLLLLYVCRRTSLYIINCHRGDSYRIQTYNLLIRSQMLYSVELRSRGLF